MDSGSRHQQADPKAISVDTEGKKYEFKPKALNITWGKDKRYWKINDEVAELLQVSWLEVTGTSGKLKPKTTYKISFEISVEPHAFGWEGITIYVVAKVGKQGNYKPKPFNPDSANYSGNRTLTIPGPESPLTVKMGESGDDLKLSFGLYEVLSGGWKGGLKIYKAIVEEISDKNQEITK